MTAKLAALDGVLEPFRPGFDADGFDVSVQDFASTFAACKLALSRTSRS